MCRLILILEQGQHKPKICLIRWLCYLLNLDVLFLTRTQLVSFDERITRNLLSIALGHRKVLIHDATHNITKGECGRKNA